MGGWTALPITQSVPCLERAGYSNISSEFVLVMMFGAVFHAVSLLWIMGFVHTKDMARSSRTIVYVRPGVPRDVPMPTDWLHPMLCCPFLCLDVSMVVTVGLSLYTFFFLEQLMEYEPETFVDRFCVSLDDTEEALLWMQISLMFFGMTLLMGCVYCCLIRIATKDISILSPGNQWDVTAPRLDPAGAIHRGVIVPSHRLGQEIYDQLAYSDSEEAIV